MLKVYIEKNWSFYIKIIYFNWRDYLNELLLDLNMLRNTIFFFFFLIIIYYHLHV
jgi:ABC-type lipoprotein release transport system permease subunit